MCPMCLVGYHASCTGGNCDCMKKGYHETVLMGYSIEPVRDSDDLDLEDSSDRTRGSNRNSDSFRNLASNTHRLKRDAALKDQQSTGRKRAARLYPLNKEAPCEWRGYANCGGGPEPIVGCLNGIQEARHHGPDKSVSNNENGNVHRICHRCHYNWHAKNNADYDWNDTRVKAHNPRLMTDEDRVIAFNMDAKYNATKEKRIKIKD